MSLLCQARIGSIIVQESVYVCRLRRWSRSPRRGRIGLFIISSAVHNFECCRHPFIISFLCERLEVPTRDKDDIIGSIEPIGRKFFWKDKTATYKAYAEHAAAAEAATAAPPPPPQHQMDLELPLFSPPLMVVVQ
ncbi:hypothetical protein A2U01_0030639, partial [Trifolium medium]|nr:hypothetical protein [Trifolium medium]